MGSCGEHTTCREKDQKINSQKLSHCHFFEIWKDWKLEIIEIIFFYFENKMLEAQVYGVRTHHTHKRTI